jgi:hypothetical protein
MSGIRGNAELAGRLRRAIGRSGADDVRRLDLAWRLGRLGYASEALEEYARVTLAGRLPIEYLVRLATLAVEVGHVALARHCLGAAQRAGLEAEVQELRALMAGTQDDPRRRRDG